MDFSLLNTSEAICKLENYCLHCLVIHKYNLNKKPSNLNHLSAMTHNVCDSKAIFLRLEGLNLAENYFLYWVTKLPRQTFSHSSSFNPSPSSLSVIPQISYFIVRAETTTVKTFLSFTNIFCFFQAFFLLKHL